ncbi:hypothetical protein AU374_01155 [Cupriavidus metallidurans]|nr:hypothetical protein AU374_01155 [Cupriavidus metallidurans]
MPRAVESSAGVRSFVLLTGRIASVNVIWMPIPVGHDKLMLKSARSVLTLPTGSRLASLTGGSGTSTCGVVTVQLLAMTRVPGVIVMVRVTVSKQLPENWTVMEGRLVNAPDLMGPVTMSSAEK